MNTLEKLGIFTDPLTVGCVPRRDLIDKRFQQSLLINQTMSNYQRKRGRRVESILVESSSSPTWNFLHLHQKKGCADKSI